MTLWSAVQVGDGPTKMLIFRYAAAIVGAARPMAHGDWWVTYCGGWAAAPLDPVESIFVDSGIAAWHHVKHKLQEQHAAAERAKYG